MNAKTRLSLLGYGLTVELVDQIATHGHTVSLLRAMGKVRLVDTYGSADAELILDRLRRKPIEPEVVDALVNESDGCCCFCEDGNGSRPYEIHHIDEYAETQDNSKDNLLVVCPNHHQGIHDRGITTAEQKNQRSLWCAQVRVAKDYRQLGLAFPYSAFVPLNYESPPSVAELVEFVRVRPATATLVCPPSIVDDALSIGTSGKITLIQGRSGAGKSTVAIAVGSRLDRGGRRVFRYRPPSGDAREALPEILTFLRAVSHAVCLILDDANSYCSVNDLADLRAASVKEVDLVVVWTQGERNGEAGPIDAIPSVVVTWEDIRPVIREILLLHEIEVIEVLERLLSKNARASIGVGAFSEHLDARIDRYATTAKTVSEFLFMLRGGQQVVVPTLQSLFDNDRADAAILYAAAEQIAGFERHVSSVETVDVLKLLHSLPQSPAPTPNWVEAIFEQEVRARRAVKRRGLFTTVHRDWALALLTAGLCEERTAATTKEILSRDFNVESADLARTARLWSWLRSSSAGGSFVKTWAGALSADQWELLVRRAGSHGLETLGVVADEMHLLFRGDDWTSVVAAAFEKNEAVIVQCLQSAGPESWYYISRIFMVVEHAMPELGDRIRVSWGAERVARLLERTPVEIYDWAKWALSRASERQPDWCRNVCECFSWSAFAPNLARVRRGRLEEICNVWDVLHGLGYPLRRSMLRSCVDAMCSALAGAHPKEIHFIGLNGLSFTLIGFPDEIDRIFASVDEARWATDLALSHPRAWRQMWLTSFSSFRGPEFNQRLFDRLDPSALDEKFARYAAAAPYEFRCFLWLLSTASEQRRDIFATAIEPIVERIAREHGSERSAITTAFEALSPMRGEALAAKLRAEGYVIKREPPDDDDEHETNLVASAAAMVERLRALDATGEDYIVRDILRSLEQ